MDQATALMRMANSGYGLWKDGKGIYDALNKPSMKGLDLAGSVAQVLGSRYLGIGYNKQTYQSTTHGTGTVKLLVGDVLI